MKTRLIKTHLNFIAFALIILLSACNQTGTKKAETKKIKKDEIKKEIEEVVYPLPSPFELTKMINEIEASFIIGITNPPEDYEKYFTIIKQSLNLGIYSSDLAYAATYNLTHETRLYLNSIKNLAKELDVTGAINHDLATRIESSLDNKEEVIDVITDLFYETYSYLYKNNNIELSYLILAGTWLEGLYLVTNISENTYDNINIVKIIMKQEESLKKMLDLMAVYKQNEMIKDIYTKLSKINEIYELQEGTDALTQNQVIKLTELVANYRSEIVK